MPTNAALVGEIYNISFNKMKRKRSSLIPLRSSYRRETPKRKRQKINTFDINFVIFLFTLLEIAPMKYKNF